MTSATRPSSPFIGQHIYETDTQRQLVWTGAHWRITGGNWPAFSVYRDTPVGIPHNTATDPTMTDSLDDTDGFWSLPALSGVIPAGLGGVYVVSLGGRFEANGTGYRAALGVANNNPIPGGQQGATSLVGGWQTASTLNNGNVSARPWLLMSGAQLNLRVIQTSGVVLDLAQAFIAAVMVSHRPEL